MLLVNLVVETADGAYFRAKESKGHTVVAKAFDAGEKLSA